MEHAQCVDNCIPIRLLVFTMSSTIACIQGSLTQKAKCGGQVAVMDKSGPSDGGKSWSKLVRAKSKRNLESTRRTAMDKMPYTIADTKYIGGVRFVTRVYRNMARNKEVTNVVLEVKRQGAWYPVNNEGYCNNSPYLMSL